MQAIAKALTRLSQALGRPLFLALAVALFTLPAVVLAEAMLPYRFSANTAISAAQMNANFDTLNAAKLDANRVIAFIHTHTASTVDCNNGACSRLPDAVQGIDNLVFSITPLIVEGDPPQFLVNQVFYVKKYDSGAKSYYEIIWGDGGRAIPLGMRFSVIAIKQ
jgi:hypothetical protein